MLSDQRLQPLPGQVILEPIHLKPSLLLVEDPGQVAATMQGLLVRVGAECPSNLTVGLKVLFVPHGGTLLTRAAGEPERLVLPADQIIGTVED